MVVVKISVCSDVNTRKMAYCSAFHYSPARLFLFLTHNQQTFKVSVSDRDLPLSLQIGIVFARNAEPLEKMPLHIHSANLQCRGGLLRTSKLCQQRAQLTFPFT